MNILQRSPVKFKFAGFGWKVKLQVRRGSYFITVMKQLVIGNFLKKGDELEYHLGTADGKRAILLVFEK